MFDYEQLKSTAYEAALVRRDNYNAKTADAQKAAASFVQNRWVYFLDRLDRSLRAAAAKNQTVYDEWVRLGLTRDEVVNRQISLEVRFPSPPDVQVREWSDLERDLILDRLRSDYERTRFEYRLESNTLVVSF